MLTKTVVSTARRRSFSAAHLDLGDVKVSASANAGQRSPPKDGETQPDDNSVTSSNRRVLSPSGEESDIRERQPIEDFPLQKESHNGQL